MAASAERDVAFGATERANGDDLSLATDPLGRLEAELGAASSEQPEGKRLHEETWKLLEEAWSLVTECLVIRDGLLEACQEVERTMSGIQDRLGALPAMIESDGREGPMTDQERPPTDEPIASSSSSDDIAR
jgi:hypothetical protein